MSSSRRSRPTVFVLFLLLIIVLALSASTSFAKKQAGRLSVADVKPLGMVTFATGYMFEETEVGGLSGITYDAKKGVFYALSDDRNVGRYYTVDIDLSDGTLEDGDVTFADVTFLRDQKRKPFAPGSIDPEGIELLRPGQLYISSEGDADAAPPINPFVRRFNLKGKQNKALTIPDKFLPDGTETYGIRDNLAFESLTSTPNRRFLATATENALLQDGPPSTLTEESPSRLLEFRRGSKRPGSEFVYIVSTIPKDSDPPGIFADNGLVELQALDNKGTFLAMERSFALGVGNTVRLFEISTQGATDVAAVDSLVGAVYTPMSKAFVADFEDDLAFDPDNLEGMTFGPRLPGGYISLIVVSDNNFNPGQTTQFILLGVKLMPNK